jgi:hypothetical protein
MYRSYLQEFYRRVLSLLTDLLQKTSPMYMKTLSLKDFIALAIGRFERKTKVFGRKFLKKKTERGVFMTFAKKEMKQIFSTVHHFKISFEKV